MRLPKIMPSSMFNCRFNNSILQNTGSIQLHIGNLVGNPGLEREGPASAYADPVAQMKSEPTNLSISKHHPQVRFFPQRIPFGISFPVELVTVEPC